MSTLSERHENFRPARVRCLELSVSETCNYMCKYCTFWRNSDSKVCLMDIKLARMIVSDFLSYNACSIDNTCIYFGTGEPMLNWELISNIVSLVRSANTETKLNFMTNGSLIAEEHVNFFKTYKLGVGLSIDGKRELQNRTRTSANQEIDSFDVIMNCLAIARPLNYTFHSLSSTFCSPGFYNDAMYVMNLCLENDIAEFALDFDLESLTDDNIGDVADELILVYKEAVKNNLSVFGYWLIPYLNQYTTNQKKFCGNVVGESICVSSEGKLKVCGYDYKTFDYYTSFSNVEKNLSYVEYLSDHNKMYPECQACPIMELCAGQCIIRSVSHSSWLRNCLFFRTVYFKMIEN